MTDYKAILFNGSKKPTQAHNDFIAAALGHYDFLIVSENYADGTESGWYRITFDAAKSTPAMIKDLALKCEAQMGLFGAVMAETANGGLVAPTPVEQNFSFGALSPDALPAKKTQKPKTPGR